MLTRRPTDGNTKRCNLFDLTKAFGVLQPVAEEVRTAQDEFHGSKTSSSLLPRLWVNYVNIG